MKAKEEEHAGHLAHAARQAAKAGKKEFSLGGKTFPVTAKVEEETVDEVAPPGWEKTVKAMKKHKDKIDNPWALAHSMKNKGYKSHVKEGIEMRASVALLESVNFKKMLDGYIIFATRLAASTWSCSTVSIVFLLLFHNNI